MFKTIQTKTMFFLITFVVCFTVVAAYLIIVGIEGTAKSNKADSMKKDAVMFATLVNNEMGGDETLIESDGSRKIILKSISSIQDQDGYRFFLINKSGKVTGLKGSGDRYELSFKGDASFQDIYKNRKYYVTALAKIPGADGWYAGVEQLKSMAYGSLNLVKTMTIALVLLVIVILWNLARSISVKIQKPIQQLAAATADVASGNISSGVETDENGELSEIADSFNFMLDRLKSTMRQVMDKSGEALSMAEIMEYVDANYDKMTSGIIGINTIGEIILFNKAAESITGLKEEDILGRDTSNPLPPEIVDLVVPLKRCLSVGSIKVKTITEIKNTGGEVIPVLYSINIQFGPNDEVLGGICIFRTIEEIKNFEASATRIKNLESLGEMAASLAHEIRNPLTSIRGYAQLLEADVGPEGSDELGIIVNEVDRLNDMLNRFLNFARPKVPELELCNVNDVIKYTANLMKTSIPEDTRFKMRLENVPMVMLDKELFEPVLINLIMNATQASPHNIVVESHYRRARKMVSIVVEDDGIGIPAENADKLFDPFFTTRAEGTGMGLAIAARTVEAHGGVLEAESLKGQMTRFTILLPVVDEIE